jgi:hypothetical protein
MQFWTPEKAAEVIGEDCVNAARALPGLAEATRRSAANWLPRPGDNRMVNATLRDLGRMISGIWAIYLDATPGGLTLSRLAKLLEGTSLSSPGRARALLIYMRFLGYVTPARLEEDDNRVRRYAVTPALLAAFHERYRRDLATIAGLDPLVDAMAARLEDEPAFRLFAAVHGDFLAAGFKSYRAEGPTLALFSERFSGMIVLALILLAGEPGDSFPPRRPIRFTTAGLSREAGISRTQVRRLLQAAQAAGFLELIDEGRARLTPLMFEHLEMLIAGVLVIYRECARIALAQLDGPAAAAVA